ncbi:MAG TPA: N-acetylmuramoyl-L-alanine amidase [Nocardioides sp.]|nr:N-acetylmuramoyl-L-alanine amidase [Nocardioides sp.]
MAYKSSTRGTRPVSLIAIHTAEGARTARNLAAYFYRPDIQASSHVCIDAAETLQIVDYGRAAWTLRSGNPISDNAELCGFARWTRAQWLSTGRVDGVDNPRAMLDRAADWIRARCDARRIPKNRLAIVALRGGGWGVIAHDDWTKAMNDGTHWDPGPGFPWDYVLNRVNAGSAPAPAPPEEDYMPNTALLKAGKNQHLSIPCAGVKKFLYICAAYDDEFDLLQMDFVHPTGDTDGPFEGGKGFHSHDDGQGNGGKPWRWNPNYPGPFDFEDWGRDDVCAVTLRWNSNHDVMAQIG